MKKENTISFEFNVSFFCILLLHTRFSAAIVFNYFVCVCKCVGVTVADANLSEFYVLLLHVFYVILLNGLNSIFPLVHLSFSTFFFFFCFSFHSFIWLNKFSRIWIRRKKIHKFFHFFFSFFFFCFVKYENEFY